MSNTPTVSVHEIEDLPLRSLFAREDRECTPWLAEPAAWSASDEAVLKIILQDRVPPQDSWTVV